MPRRPANSHLVVGDPGEVGLITRIPASEQPETALKHERPRTVPGRKGGLFRHAQPFVSGGLLRRVSPLGSKNQRQTAQAQRSDDAPLCQHAYPPFPVDLPVIIPGNPPTPLARAPGGAGRTKRVRSKITGADALQRLGWQNAYGAITNRSRC